MLSVIRRLFTRKCPDCGGKGYRLMKTGSREIRQSCVTCRKSGRVKR